jgi:hypothetical protein
MNLTMAHMASVSPTMNILMDLNLEDTDMVIGIDADTDDPGDAVAVPGGEQHNN